MCELIRFLRTSYLNEINLLAARRILIPREPIAFAARPVHHHINLQALQQLVSDQLEGIISHSLDGALVLSESVIEGNFVMCEPLLRAALEGIALSS